jgi:hypothetical protein
VPSPGFPFLGIGKIGFFMRAYLPQADLLSAVNLFARIVLRGGTGCMRDFLLYEDMISLRVYWWIWITLFYLTYGIRGWWLERKSDFDVCSLTDFVGFYA